MLSRIAYILRETWASLRRNLTLTVAALLTVVATLSLLGFSLLIQGSVGNLLVKWRSGVQVIVFMSPDATQDQIDAVDRTLAADPSVKSRTFIDKAAALEEFKRLFPDSPELYTLLGTQGMPTSFKVTPVSADDATISRITAQLNRQPNVLSVQSAREVVAFVRTLSDFFRVATIVGSAVLMIASVALIWNTIRTGMFARRREIEVMKLVGATNWFIRWPFVVEGIIQGLIGGLLACGITALGNTLWKRKVVQSALFSDFRLLQATTGQFRTACIWMLAVGVVAGAVASATAATRFLDV